MFYFCFEGVSELFKGHFKGAERKLKECVRKSVFFKSVPVMTGTKAEGGLIFTIPYQIGLDMTPLYLSSSNTISLFNYFEIFRQSLSGDFFLCWDDMSEFNSKIWINCIEVNPLCLLVD